MLNRSGLSALGLDANEIIAQLQSWAGSFLASKQQLYEARKKIETLYNNARATGYTTLGDKQITLSELEQMHNENTRLISDNADLERKFLSAMEEWNQIKAAADVGAEVMVGIPGIAGVSGLDAIPVATIAWATGAAILVGSIAYFMSRVKSHLNRLAGATAGSLIGIGTIALLAGGAYLLLGRK